MTKTLIKFNTESFVETIKFESGSGLTAVNRSLCRREHLRNVFLLLQRVQMIVSELTCAVKMTWSFTEFRQIEITPQWSDRMQQ